MFRARAWGVLEKTVASVLVVSSVATLGFVAAQSAPVLIFFAGLVSTVAFITLTVIVVLDRRRIRAEANELKARLERALAEDPETGLSSIQRFRRDLTIAAARFKRSGEHFTLVVFRLPSEREPLGVESAVREIARHLTLSLRTEDTLARVGDRELGALLTSTNLKSAEAFLDRVEPVAIAYRARWGAAQWARETPGLDAFLAAARSDLQSRLHATPTSLAS